MANTITTTVINDGSKHLDVVVNILGDGSGEETDTLLIDRSTYAPAGTKTSVVEVYGNLGGFTAALSFDATADLVFARLPDGNPFKYQWFDDEPQGISSTKAGAGATGDILISTSGLGNGEGGTFTLRMRKF